MATITIASPCPKSNHLTRRAALRGTAAIGAAVLPAGVAMAATAGDVDPGLAALEAGYARWCEMSTQWEKLGDAEKAAMHRAWAPVPEHPDPEPVPSERIAQLQKLTGHVFEAARDPAIPVTIPQDLLDEHDAHWKQWREWLDAKPRASGADFEEAYAIKAKRDRLWAKAENLRKRLLKVRTTSARGLLIKLALATDSHLDQIDERFRRPRYYDTFGNTDGLMPPLLADLRAMAAGA